MNSHYRFDHTAGLYYRPERPEFRYSDSEEAEQRLLEIVNAARDRSSGSAELSTRIGDWVSCYHLSPERSNLLRPFLPLLAGSVLEVGCGCGALTRFLGENAASVVAVEGSPRRGQIAAARCAGLPNVRIYCDNFQDFSLEERFDLVTGVGVVEYSPVFFSGPDPFSRMLVQLGGYLSEGGYLLIAIENRLGLKYFAGAPEDHSGEPFQGLHDLYGPGTPLTLGKREWEERLRATGFDPPSFWYPFPDYKLPTLIASAAAFREPDLDMGTLLRTSAAGQGFPYERLFSEELAWPVMVNNGLAEDLANSFLILTRKSGAAAAGWNPEGLVYHYSTSRRPQYAVEMLIQRGSDGLTVRRNRLAAAETDDSAYRQRVMDEPYLTGALYSDGLFAVLNRPGWTTTDIARWAQAWVDDVRTSGSAGDRGPLLPPDFMDRVPFNLICRPHGELCAFDQEYIATGPLELDFVVFRGLWGSLARVRSCAAPAPELRSRMLSEIVFSVMRLLGIEVPGEEQARLIANEAEFQEIVTGAPRERAALAIADARLRIRKLADPSRRAELLSRTCNFQLFWRLPGQEFSEGASSLARLELAAKRQALRLRIPPGLTPLAQFRLDPAEHRGAARLFALRLLDSQDRPLWVWDGRAASLRPAAHDMVLAEDGEAAVLLFVSHDPRLMLPIPDGLLAGTALESGGTLEAELAWLGAMQPAAQEDGG
jgi:SAM-dependent methyltransferase